MSQSKDTIVFIPAWNEEDNLPAVLDELSRELPEADVLVVDDGSTDRTAELARTHGATVLGFDENRGLRAVIAAGYDYAHREGYAYCGRVDADGQHPAAELRRLIERVRGGECDVAVGSRFVAGDGYAPYRYRPSPARSLGTGLLRRAMAFRLGRPFGDATSGMYAANAQALPLIRLSEAGLTVHEVPVNMRDRASGESKLRGKKAVKLVLTVVGTLLLYRRVRGIWPWPAGRR